MVRALSPQASYWSMGLLTSGLCVLPLLVGPYPPATDLPQHVAQVARAVLSQTADGHGPLAEGQYLAWWAPNNFIYTPMRVLWSVFGPQHTAQATLVFLALFWVTAHFLVGRVTHRPAASVMLACLSLYNGILYWGMLNFLVAWPCFLLWWLLFDGLLRCTKHRVLPTFLLTVAASFLLAWAHVLLLGLSGMAMLCSLVVAWRDARRKRTRVSARRLLLACASLLPVGALALPWAFHLNAERQSAGFFVGAYFTNSTWARLEYLVTEAMACGTPLPGLFFVSVLLWVLAGIHRSAAASDDAEHSWRVDLLALGLLTIVGSLLLPDKFLNTIQFAVRWLPCGVALLCLASPGPAVRPAVRNALIGCLLGTFSLSVTLRNLSFQTEELSGLDRALNEVPQGSRILGLDFIKTSENFPRARPFLHLTSYATALRQASTNFDFAQHGTGLIRGKSPQQPWTPGIEWVAEWARPHDLIYFDYALVGARPELHGRFLLAQWMRPVTFSGQWRLYRIETGFKARP